MRFLIILALISNSAMAACQLGERSVSKKIILALMAGTETDTIKLDCSKVCICVPAEMKINYEDAEYWVLNGSVLSYDSEKKLKKDSELAAEKAAKVAEMKERQDALQELVSERVALKKLLDADSGVK